MATADDNTTTTAACNILPESSLINFPLANAMRHLDCRQLSEDELLELAFGCDDAVSGLHQTIKFLGDSLISLCTESEITFSSESVCQLGHSLCCISQLLPAMHQLSDLADAQLHATE